MDGRTLKYDLGGAINVPQVVNCAVVVVAWARRGKGPRKAGNPCRHGDVGVTRACCVGLSVFWTFARPPQDASATWADTGTNSEVTDCGATVPLFLRHQIDPKRGIQRCT